MKQYSIEYSLGAEKDFAKLPKNIQQRIITKLEYYEASEDPFAFAEKLVDQKNRFRFRIGNYRVIFTPKDNNTYVILLILKIGHRSKIYE